MGDYFRLRADELVGEISDGPRLGVLGSASFWHADSEVTCQEIGRKLSRIPNLSLVTGGMSAVGLVTAKGFAADRALSTLPLGVYHLLPEGYPPRDVGETLAAGADMLERRELLARVCPIYLVVEGGPGTAHEVSAARSPGATILPVGRSGGVARRLYEEPSIRKGIDARQFDALGQASSCPRDVAAAVAEIVQACFDAGSSPR